MSASDPTPPTPEAIRTVELPRSRRGYDEEATRQLLDDLATRFEELLAVQNDLREQLTEQDELRQRVAELEKELASREDAEQTVSRALLAATRAGEDLVKTAEGEAEEILAAARREAEASERELEENRKAIEREREQVRTELRREVLATTREDLVRLHDEAEPLLELVQSLTGGLRSLVRAGTTGEGDGRLVDDLRPPTGEERRTRSASD